MHSDMPRENARLFGEKAEEWAEDNRGVACLNGTVDGEKIGTDLSVEVKGCKIKYENGSPGRFRFWKRQHELLREKDGVYLLIVYDVDRMEPVQLDRFAHWSSVEELMPGEWYPAREHSMHSDQTQIRWQRFFPDVDGCMRDNKMSA